MSKIAADMMLKAKQEVEGSSPEGAALTPGTARPRSWSQLPREVTWMLTCRPALTRPTRWGTAALSTASGLLMPHQKPCFMLHHEVQGCLFGGAILELHCATTQAYSCRAVPSEANTAPSLQAASAGCDMRIHITSTCTCASTA